MNTTFDPKSQAATQDAVATYISDDALGYLDCFESSIPITLPDGETVELKPLSIEDYEPWCEEMTQKTRTDRLLRLKDTKFPPDAEWRIRTNIHETEFTPNDFTGLVFTSKWGRRILNKALSNAGVSPEMATKFLKSIPARSAEMLAVRVDGLHTKTQFDQIYEIVLGGKVSKPVADAGATFGGERPLATASETGG